MNFTVRIVVLIVLLSCLTQSVFSKEIDHRENKIKLEPFVDYPTRAIEKSIGLKDVSLTMDLKVDQTPAKNQGSRGACAYFSATALAESLIKKKHKININISEEFLIYYAKTIQGDYCRGDGSDAYSNLKAISNGFLLEKDSPYQPSWFEKGLPCAEYDEDSSSTPTYCYAHLPPEMDVPVSERLVNFSLIERHSFISSSKNVIERMNRDKNGVIVSLPVNHKGWNGETGYAYYDEEMRKECKENPDDCGGHSILVVGYDISKKILYFKNSWGNTWGEKGYGSMPFSYVDKYSRRSAYSATLEGRIKLPTDYDVIPIPEGNNFNFDISKDDGIKVKMTGNFMKVRNRVIYGSTFIVKPSDSLKPISDDNVELLKVPESHTDEFGTYVRGYFNKMTKENDTVIISDSNPENMIIPQKIIDLTSWGSETKSYLRISAYIHNDIDGWKKVFRTYEPVTF